MCQFGARTTSTGHGALRMTPSATLPLWRDSRISGIALGVDMDERHFTANRLRKLGAPPLRAPKEVGRQRQSEFCGCSCVPLSWMLSHLLSAFRARGSR